MVDTIAALKVHLMSGTGTPNGVITAAKGSLYIQLDAVTNVTRMWINTTGSTVWTAFNTVA